jgi:formylmethanofuran dehydrogenase subunit E
MIENFGDDLGSILDMFYPPGYEPPVSDNYVRKLIIKSSRIYGDVYNYDEVTDQDIKDKNITVLCTKCNNKWNTNMDEHIWCRRGCPVCHHCYSKITRTELAIVVKEKYGDKFSYEGIKDKCSPARINQKPDKESQIKLTTKITITCNKCSHSWTRNLRTFLLGKAKCSKCLKS